MTREEAKIQILSLNANDIFVENKAMDLINNIFNDFEIEDICNSTSVAYEDGYQIATKELNKELASLKKDRDYWKTSFNKQVEVRRKQCLT